MSWSRKSLTLLCIFVLGFSMLGAKNDDGAKEDEKSESKKPHKGAADAKSEGAEGEAGKGSSPGKISVPVPPGHDAKGLVIPMRNEQGKLQMRFTMEIGKRTDVNHMDMTTLLIETFDEDGKEEMSINLPQSILDLDTRIITTQSGVLIKRSDFELTGKTMEFNTETKAGRVAGKVRMLIYNLDDETNSTSKEKPRAK
jgi:hypothetical protein